MHAVNSLRFNGETPPRVHHEDVARGCEVESDATGAERDQQDGGVRTLVGLWFRCVETGGRESGRRGVFLIDFLVDFGFVELGEDFGAGFLGHCPIEPDVLDARFRELWGDEVEETGELGEDYRFCVRWYPGEMIKEGMDLG